MRKLRLGQSGIASSNSVFCWWPTGYELAVCHNGTVHRYLIRRFKNNYG